MAAGNNRRRNRKKTGDDTGRSLWGSLFQNSQDGKSDVASHPFYSPAAEEFSEETDSETRGSYFRRLWKSFNVLSAVAVGLFLVFTATLLVVLLRMWSPQDLSDIAGYKDSGRARDLESLIVNANGAPVTFTEAELNRYLRDTCRMRQTGIFSIIASGQGVAVRIHDGYAELVLDRMLGSDIHQTTSVNLTFKQENKLGRTELHVDFKGGNPIAGTMPRGGSIGSIAVPQRHIIMLKPALETLLTCYPQIIDAVEHYRYCPIFTEGKNGAESRVHLVPYTPDSSPLQ